MKWKHFYESLLNVKSCIKSCIFSILSVWQIERKSMNKRMWFWQKQIYARIDFNRTLRIIVSKASYWNIWSIFNHITKYLVVFMWYLWERILICGPQSNMIINNNNIAHHSTLTILLSQKFGNKNISKYIKKSHIKII